MENIFEIQLYGFTYKVRAQFAKYIHNNRTALQFFDAETGEPCFDGTINIEHAPIKNNDYIVVKSYGENEGLAEELVRVGLIEPQPVGFVPSGFIIAPIHKLTNKAIQLRDAHWAELGI